MRQVVLNFTTGNVSVRAPEVGRDNSAAACEQLDFLCGLRSIFEVAVDALVDTIQGAWDQASEIIGRKQPFAWVGRVKDGVGTQLARLTADVGSTTNCSGITFTLDSTALPNTIGGKVVWPSAAPGITVDGVTYGASRPSFTFLKCADFEPLVSTTGYQAARSFIGAAVIFLALYRELNRWRPQPVLSG
jgi:hypothetical protein